MNDQYNVNLAEKYCGKLKAQGHLTIADFVYDLTVRYKAFEQELLETNAHISRIHKVGWKIANQEMSGPEIDSTLMASLKSIMESSPKQSLALHDADVIEDMAKACVDELGACHTLDIVKYTQQLRDSVKGGG